MTEPAILFSAIAYLPPEAEGPKHARGDVRIAGGRIATVAAPGSLPPLPGERVIEGSALILLPGLCNAAADTGLLGHRGLLDLADPDRALAAVAAARAGRPPAAEAADVARAAALHLAAGTTELLDILPAGPETDARARARLEAWRASGLRVRLAVDLSGTNEAGLPDLAGDGASLARSIAALPLPHQPAAMARALATGAPLILYPAEVPGTDPASAVAAGLAAAAQGARVILLEPGPIGAADAARLAAAGVAVVLAPGPATLLGRALTDGRVLLDAGVTVLIGTGLPGPGGLALQPAMRLATMAARPDRASVSDWLTNRDVLRAACRDLDGRMRTIAPGQPADLAAYDRRAPVWTPLNNLVDQFVSSETGQNAVLTLVGGTVRHDRLAARAAA